MGKAGEEEYRDYAVSFDLQLLVPGIESNDEILYIKVRLWHRNYFMAS